MFTLSPRKSIFVAVLTQLVPKMDPICYNIAYKYPDHEQVYTVSTRFHDNINTVETEGSIMSYLVLY